MSLTTKLQKLTLISLILLVVTSGAFAITLAVTAKEISPSGNTEDKAILDISNSNVINLQKDRISGYNKEKTDTPLVSKYLHGASQNFLLPYLWNAILISIVIFGTSILALIWNAQREGKINLFEP